jgi:hypothetical protein
VNNYNKLVLSSRDKGQGHLPFPTAIPRMMADPDSRKSARVMNAFMKIKKLDLAALELAYMNAPHGGGTKFTPG